MKRFLIGLCAIAFLFPAGARAFSDVSLNHSAYEAIAWMANHGIVKGFPDFTFRPQSPVTRAQLLKMVFLTVVPEEEAKKAASEMTTKKIGFTDVKKSDWFAAYVYLAKKRGTVKGYSDGTFRPENAVKQDEALKMILHEFFPHEAAALPPATPWYAFYRKLAIEKGLISAVKLSGPASTGFTRLEAAELLYRSHLLIAQKTGLKKVALSDETVFPTENIPAAVDIVSIEEEIVALTNAARDAEGIASLAVSAKLTSAAQAKTQDMFAKQYFEHIAPDGKTPVQFMKENGYDFSYAGENLALFSGKFPSAAELVDGWLKSPPHRKNLLSSNFQEIGIAVMSGTLNGKKVTLAVQMFAAPKGGKPV